MMAKTHQIKSVINSTEKTAVITQAMQLVSASRLPTARNALNAAQPFSDTIEDIIFNYAFDECSTHPFFNAPEKYTQVGVITITSDRGLCGGLNLALYKEFLKQVQLWDKDKITPILSVAGKKGQSFFSDHAHVISTACAFGDKPNLEDLMALITPMIHAYKTKQVGKVFILSNQYVNTLTQKPIMTQVLPIEPKGKVKSTGAYSFEPSHDEVLDPLLTRYIEAKIYRTVVENIACEHAARMVAMQNATDSAQSIISELNLTYNKARQAIITQEIAEIAAGAYSGEET